MTDARRFRALVGRAVIETRERIWGGIAFWAVFAVIFAILSLAFGLPWVSVTLLTLASLAIMLALAFAMRLFRAARHPDLNDQWVRERETVIPGEGQQLLFLSIAPLRATYNAVVRCEITDPGGGVYNEHIFPEAMNQPPRLLRAFSVYYPMVFPDAPPVTQGTYRVRWLMRDGRRWHELLSYPVEVGEDIQVVQDL